MLVSLISVCCNPGCNPVDENTEYASGFEKAEFEKIKLGTTLDEVYTRVGAPLLVHVNPDRFSDGAYRQERSDAVTLEHIRELLADERVEVYLYYSSTKQGKGHSYLYRLDLREGRVFNRVVRAHID